MGVSGLGGCHSGATCAGEGCATEDRPSVAGTAGEDRGGNPGRAGAGGEASGGSGGEYLDGDGRCRVDTESPLMGCPATYAEAQGTESLAFCRGACSGSCGGVLVFIDYCTPSRGCAYDPEQELLVGRYFGDDVRVHCDDASYGVIQGDWPLAPEGCDLTNNETGAPCRFIP